MDILLKWLGVLGGVAMIIIGSYAIFNPEVTILSITLYIGIVLLVMGIFNIINYFQKRKENMASGWILTDGIVNIVLAIILFSNDFISVNIIPLIFSIWILFLGIQRIGLAVDIKKFNLPYYKILLVIGILAIVFSIITFIKPLIAALAISMIVGITLIFYGVITITASISLGNIYKYFKNKNIWKRSNVFLIDYFI